MFQCWLFSVGAQRQAVATALYDKTLYGEKPENNQPKHENKPNKN